MRDVTMTTRQAELVTLCERVEQTARLLGEQAKAGRLDDSLLPADVAARLRQHVLDIPATTAAGVISRAVTFYFRQLCNCESVPPAMARMLLAGRTVDPVRRDQEGRP